MKKLTKVLFIAAMVCMSCGLFGEDSAPLKALKAFQKAQTDFDFKKISFLCTSDVVMTEADGKIYNQKTIKELYECKAMYGQMKKAFEEGKYAESADMLEKLSGKTFAAGDKEKLVANNGAGLKKIFTEIEVKYAGIRNEVLKALQGATYEVIAEDGQTAIIKATYQSLKDKNAVVTCYVVMSFEDNMWLVKRAIAKENSK